MGRPRKHLLREVTAEEQEVLKRLSRSSSEPAARVARAKILLAITEGNTIAGAAALAGRRSRLGVVELITRFNERGLASLETGHGGGPAIKYVYAEKERILRELDRKPDLEKDGTSTWSLNTLQRALRSAEDGLPEVSTYVISQVLHKAGLSWQKSRTWCQTGEVLRKRKCVNVNQEQFGWWIPRRRKKGAIEQAYTSAAELVWCQDEAGPYQEPHSRNTKCRSLSMLKLDPVYANHARWSVSVL